MKKEVREAGGEGLDGVTDWHEREVVVVGAAPVFSVEPPHAPHGLLRRSAAAPRLLLPSRPWLRETQATMWRAALYPAADPGIKTRVVLAKKFNAV